MRTIILAGLVAFTAACDSPPADRDASSPRGAGPPDGPYLVVLGIGQDGGYPQAGTPPGPAWAPALRRYATALGLVDPQTGERWLFEATPDFRDQLHEFDRIQPASGTPDLAGIFLTHAHVGHYAGLIHLGHEIIGARDVPVYAMPRLRQFLSSHGPWDQLVRFANIGLRELADGVPVQLNERLTVTPFIVPHRDEYSETVGFRIDGPARSAVFLPDIDKWERWEKQGTRIEDVVAAVDIAYLDATFFQDGEVPGRAMADIPHPFIIETMQRFADAPAEVRQRIRFIHLNRTNPAAFEDGPERRRIEEAGFRVARMLEILPL
jgi:pyrroloquinoline quinone biosynthesis protein B